MGNRVVGIDVGGERKGYHAVLLCDGKFEDKISHGDPKVIARWCKENKAAVVAVDAPCQWSMTGRSRAAERDLNEKGIHCFYSPMRKLALKSSFYDWMFNGERLYKALAAHYHLYQGKPSRGPVCMETFPHAIACTLNPEIKSAKNKNKTRRKVLAEQGIESILLTNIDFVDAALCAVAAADFQASNFEAYGDAHEGYIIVPRI
jgi:predicted nuclease with RNAse H fold